jgi:hypothetical protein
LGWWWGRLRGRSAVVSSLACAEARERMHSSGSLHIMNNNDNNGVSAHSRNHYCYYSLALSRALSSSHIGREEACVGVCVRVIVVAYYGLWRNQWWASYKMRIAQLCDSYFSSSSSSSCCWPTPPTQQQQRQQQQQDGKVRTSVYIYICACVFRPSISDGSFATGSAHTKPPATHAMCVLWGLGHVRHACCLVLGLSVPVCGTSEALLEREPTHSKPTPTTVMRDASHVGGWVCAGNKNQDYCSDLNTYIVCV